MTKPLLAALAALTGCQLAQIGDTSSLHRHRSQPDAPVADTPRPDARPAADTTPAETKPAEHRLPDRLTSYRHRVDAIASAIDDRYNESQWSSDECWKLAKADGTDEAKQICTQFDAQTTLRPIRKTLHTHAWSLRIAKEDLGKYRKSANVTDDTVKKLVAEAKQCNAEIDRALADGAPADVDIAVEDYSGKLTLTTARNALCGALEDVTKGEAELAGEKKAERANIAKPYTAVGISGDRLSLLVDHDGFQFYGVGKSALSSPSELAHAKLIFELGHGSGVWTVVRYQFDGNKLVNSTTAEYDREPGAAAFK